MGKLESTSTAIRAETWPVSRLAPYDKNPRRHDSAVERMAEVIGAYGFRYPILVRSDGGIIDGHLRLKAAVHLGLTEVPVALADDMSDADVRAFRIAVNKSATFAEWDAEALLDELSAVSGQLTGFDDAEILALETLAGAGTDVDRAITQSLAKHATPVVKVSLQPDALASLEKAILATGLINRAEAVRAIAEAYCSEKR